MIEDIYRDCVFYKRNGCNKWESSGKVIGQNGVRNFAHQGVRNVGFSRNFPYVLYESFLKLCDISKRSKIACDD